MDKIVSTMTLKEFIEILKEHYSDKFEVDTAYVGTPEYWKKAGVIELINSIEQLLKKE